MGKATLMEWELLPTVKHYHKTVLLWAWILRMQMVIVESAITCDEALEVCHFLSYVGESMSFAQFLDLHKKKKHSKFFEKVKCLVKVN
jgi:hypothetical protein